MNRFDALKRWTWSVFIVGLLAFAFAGCDGDTGPQGPQGIQGPPGADGNDGADGTDATADPIAAAKIESCGTCHAGVAEEVHQAVYESYVNPSTLAMTITSVTSAPEAGLTTFTVTVEFSIADSTNPAFDAGTDLASMDQRSFYAVQYNSVTGQYLNSATLFGRGRTNVGDIVSNGGGTYTLTTTGVAYAPESPVAPFDGAQVYGYIARGSLFEHIGGTGAEIPAGGHVHLYEDVSNAAFPVGTAASASASSYVSAANVEGCQKCHGTPYLKHGYRAGKITGIPDFAGCKACHYDNRNGGHGDWQYMVDEPFEWATGVLTGSTAINAAYPYTANVMNDTHMSHAMEFPYPQSMQNCATCHGEVKNASGTVIAPNKLDQVISDATFSAQTCLSCHPLNGTGAWPKTVDANGNEVLDDRGRSIPEKYLQGNRAPALAYLWWEAGVESFHPSTQAQALASPCGDCHKVNGAATTNGKGLFSDYHTGYDVNITDSSGVRYADAYTVAIDAASYDPVTGLITVEFSATNPAVVPELYVSFYGWGSKNFIAAGHERDGNAVDCPNSNPSRAGCQMEYTPESSGGSANPIFTEDAASVPGDWKVTVDPSQWQLTKTDDIPTMIADGKIKRVELMLAPELNLSNLTPAGPNLDVVLTGTSKTLNLVTGLTENDYFKGVNAAVSTEKCNVCHDALASSFHSESGRGGDGIELCKNCHNVTYAGSHLEMASRSIDSYVHAIHSFQAFDPGDTFKTFDPVLAKRYDLHIKHVFPNFTIRNCEACHTDASKGNVPNQAESMPSLLSSSDTVATWYSIVNEPGNPLNGLAVENPAGRKIGSVPQYVVGAASRACGGCHRARFIRDDAAGELASWNAHTQAFGTLVENSEPNDGVLYGVIDKIMSLFE
jgi:hypothetical protein